jgi:hypothetical protein
MSTLRARIDLLIRFLEERRATWDVFASMVPVFLILAGLPIASVAVGSWGQLGRHGVAPVWIALLILVSLTLLGGLHGLYALVIIRSVGKRNLSVALVGVPFLISGTIAALVLVRHNWPSQFRQIPLIPDVAILQAAIAVAVFITLMLLVVRFRLQRPLTIFTALALLSFFVPLQIQQGGLRPSATEIVLTDQAPINRNVLWMIPDELTASAVLMPNGEVWPSLPNIRRLQQMSTTYTSAVAVSVNTSQAIPAMLSGISDLRTIQPSDLAALSRRQGVLSAISELMTTRITSPFFTALEPEPSTIQRAVSQPLRIGKELLSLALDLIFSPRLEDAVTGPNGLIGRFFPESGADFWGATGQRDSTAITQFRELLEERPGTDEPWFFVWHSLDTHSPWNVDPDGRRLFHSDEPCPGESRCAPLAAASGYSVDRESEVLSRRLAAMSAQFFDKRVGQFLDALDASNSLERTIIVIGSDHGTAIASIDGGRHNAGSDLMRDGVAHVPLIIKFAGQLTPSVVTNTVSMGQILPTVIDELGVGVTAVGFQMSPSLPRVDNAPSTDVEELEIGIWIGYDDLWSWRSLTWIPMPSVGYYGAGDWFAEPSLPLLEQLGFDMIDSPPLEQYRLIADASVYPIKGDSEIAFLRIESAISSCPRQSIGVVVDRRTFINSRFAENVDGTIVQSWAGVPRNLIDSTQVWCKSAP